MKVHWTDTAEAHLDCIYTYIARDSKTYARRLSEWPMRVVIDTSVLVSAAIRDRLPERMLLWCVA